MTADAAGAFQDMLPGRLREQSYQVFADNGYYANAAYFSIDGSSQ